MMVSKNPEATRVTALKGNADYCDAEQVKTLTFSALEQLELPDSFIQPGNRIILKPNWVKEHDEQHPGETSWEYVVTHPAVIEAVACWTAKRLGDHGCIIICDAPQTDSSFKKIREYCRLDEMVEKIRRQYSGIKIELLDLRPEEWHAVDGVTVSKISLPGDPLGSTEVKLNEGSEFVSFRGEGKLYGASYDMDETNRHHHGNVHEYLLCRTPMEADVFINIPKLKTHKKVGITCALKNLVGINANKNWLPHHTEGTPADGGDQFAQDALKAKLEQRGMGALKRVLKGNYFLSRLFIPLKKMGRLVFGDTQKVIRSGNWHGNDTCWRMVLDLNKGLFFYDGEGNRRTSARKYLAVVDGIIGGEGNGPMAPDPKPCGVIIAGRHPLAVDCVAAEIMGFDFRRIPLLNSAFKMRELGFVDFQPEEITVSSNNPDWQGPLTSIKNTFSFKPHFGWVGAIERNP